MKSALTFVAAAIAVPVLLASRTSPEKIDFAVSSGTTIEKSFTVTANLRMEEFDTQINGNPPPMDIDMDMRVNSKQEIVFVDTYEAVTGDGAAKLKRRFATLSGTSATKMSNAMMGEQEMDITSSSELEGLTVVFAREEGGDGYDVRFADDVEGDTELLEGLEQDTDLLALLPRGELEVGAKYDIDPKRLVSVFAPGGNLHFKADDEEASQMGMGGEQNLADMIGELRGTATGEFTGTREIDGRKIAVIALAIDVESDHDMTDRMRDMMSGGDIAGQDVEMEVQSADVHLEMKMEGELLWDVAGGHFHALDLDGEVTSTVDISMTVDQMGQSMSIDNSVTMSGTQKLEYRATRQ